MTAATRTLAYAVALAALATVPAVGAPRQGQPFTLTLEAPERPLKAGKPLTLRVTVTNTSDHAMRVPVTRAPADVMVIYRVNVLDGLGRPVPRRPSLKNRIWYGRMGSAELQPGKSLTDEVSITYLYDLSRPGRYRVWVAELVHRGPNAPNDMARSNTITVTVVK